MTYKIDILTMKFFNTPRMKSGATLVMTFLLAILLTASLPPPARTSQARVTKPSIDPIALQQALLDLTNAWTVMCVAAHPDDEDGSTLTMLRRKYGIHTVSLFSTYGEGGQNAVGPELYEELGVIRARETLKAAEIQGSEAYFLGLRDFGYSKSAEEAFRIWGHDEALRRMVLQIRQIRPDVIITNHDTKTGHGHHQATGRLVLEAFDAAADPKRFPEQLELAATTLWQVKRLFVRMPRGTGRGGDAVAGPEPTYRIVSIDPNERDPVRGTTYAAQALKALQQHATQGPWPQSLRPEGVPAIRYRLIREIGDPLPADAKVFVDGLRLSESVAHAVQPPTLDGRPLADFYKEPDRVISTLKRYNSENRSRSDDNAEVMLDPHFHLFALRFFRAIAEAFGVTIALDNADRVQIPDSMTNVELKVTNSGDRVATIRDVTTLDWRNSMSQGHKVSKEAKPGTVTTALTLKLPTPTSNHINVPQADHLYDGRLFGERFEASVEMTVDGIYFVIPVERRFDVAPAVEIVSISPTPYMFTPANLNRYLTFKVRLTNHLTKPFKGAFGISSPSEHITDVGPEISLAASETRDFTVKTNVIPVDTPDERRTPRPDFDKIVFIVRPPGQAAAITEREVSVLYSDARVTPNLRVGYVRSFDDTLRDGLAALGVDARELTVDDVRNGDLTKFDTIIVDIRGYQAHPELVAANTRLLDYVRDGGTLVVFYHKNDEWNPDEARSRPQLAPYPITLGQSRVTDENAPITFVDRQHPLLNRPNKIDQDDFKNWIQERGLYYPDKWDAHYDAILSSSDTGEPALTGGLLAAQYGRGHYVYSSMVWYRQLRGGVPGGYRFLANLISFGHE